MKWSLRRAVAAGAATVVALAALSGCAASSRTPAHDGAGAGPAWSGTWAAAQQRAMPGNEWFGPNWSLAGFAEQSVRQLVRVSAGGSQVRIRLSNLYGATPLRIAGATIAVAGNGAAVQPGTVRALRFAGSPSTTIPEGVTAASDAVPLSVAPGQTLTVTAYFAEPTGAATFHQAGFTTTYRADGNHLLDQDAAAFAGETSHSWYYLTGVDVAGEPNRPGHAVVAFGDSLTDGSMSTPNSNHRYPDLLADRLIAEGKPMGVLNAGINGNMVLTDYPCFAGEKATTRVNRDLLEQPGVRTVIVLQGINDIGLGGTDTGCAAPPAVTPARLIEGHRALIHAAHTHGIKIIGATVPPFRGNPLYFTEANNATRIALNQWIRDSGEYDAVADIDRILGNPANPDTLLPAYDSGDNMHPNDAGMKAIADAIDLNTL
ncbi:SGNH/GDSL hydrolase family protein [Pseudonocardia acaciae]|uniref:SGNH/GDSL hydrolase family protein n=1 Tax=Pseudonocardia acaciae TaxID=551276 RepID=UPI0006841B31|nr:SGNH/GDSL hydrolase family protein [Pseudonocardia acaciae]